MSISWMCFVVIVRIFRVFSELVHHGKVLDDEKSLVDNGIKADEMIYVLRKNVRNPPEPRKKYTEIELYEFLLFFKTFEIPSETDLALLLQIRVRGFFSFNVFRFL